MKTGVFFTQRPFGGSHVHVAAQETLRFVHKLVRCFVMNSKWTPVDGIRCDAKGSQHMRPRLKPAQSNLVLTSRANRTYTSAVHMASDRHQRLQSRIKG